jgi:type IV secretory pathway TrbD component
MSAVAAPAQDGVSAAVTPLFAPVHSSLVTPILIAGVERRFAILEGGLLAVLLLAIGIHTQTLAVAAVVFFVGHPLLQKVAKRDAQGFDLYVRSLRFQSFYPAQAHPEAATLERPPFDRH